MMRTLTGLAWTSALPRTPVQRPSARPADIASAIFALVALAAAVTPILIEQSADATDPSGAHRNTARDTHAVPGAEWMLAGYSGVPYTYPSDVSVVKTGLHDVTAEQVGWDGRPFVNPIYYGVRIVSWNGTGRTGTMLDFTHSKTLARLDEEVRLSGTLDGAPAPERARLGDIFRRLEASHGHNMLTLNGLLRLPVFGLRVVPYAGLGAGVSLPHAEIQMANKKQRTYEYQVAGPVAQGLFGLELRTARVSYFFEYKFTWAPYWMPLSERDGTLLPFDLWRQVQDWFSGVEPPGGVAKTQLTSHQVIGGIGIRSAPLAAAP